MKLVNRAFEYSYFLIFLILFSLRSENIKIDESNDSFSEAFQTTDNFNEEKITKQPSTHLYRNTANSFLKSDSEMSRPVETKPSNIECLSSNSSTTDNITKSTTLESVSNNYQTTGIVQQENINNDAR